MQLHLERPDYDFFLRGADGVQALVNDRVVHDSFIIAPDALIDDCCVHDPATMETVVPGVFLAGVLAAGYDANKIFIENGKLHGDLIAAEVCRRG